MTVSTTTSRADYTGNGVTTAFAVPFYFLDNSHLTVLRTVIATGASTTLVLGTDYTVTGAGVPAGGTVTCTAAPTAAQKISILRNVPLTQLVDYVENDPFPAASHERALDQLTMEVQQVSETISRAVTLPPATTGISTQLPSALPLALIGFNGTGTALTTYDPASVITVAGSSGFVTQAFSGTGAQTAFTLSSAPGAIGNLEVFISGVRQRPTTDYTVSGLTLTFVSGAPASGTNNIFVRWGTTLGIGIPSDASVQTAKLADASVTTVKIADANVTTAKIADANVTTAKFDPAAVAPNATNATNATNLTGSGTISSTTTGTTQSANDNSTKISTTAYVDRAAALRSYISGLTLSTAGSSTTMSVAAGQASDVNNALLINLASSINKTTSAWAVGTGNGGLDTGTIANSTWYYFYAIRRPDTGVVDVVFSTSSSAPTLPTNYTQYRYIGAGLTNGSGQWTKFTQFGDTFYWDTPVLDFTGTGSATAALLTCSVPRGRKMLVFFNLGGANNQSFYLSDPSNADLAPSITTNPLAQWSLGGASTSNASAQCMTNTSAQIRHREQGAVNAYIATLGWVDLRGKDL